MIYDYFYEEQAEQFIFYRVPKVLCTEEEFRDLSSDAKLLYGLLLDRVGLSKRNGWIDEAGRVYVIFSHENVKEALCCADGKATKLFSELEIHGLIERIRQGQGKPAIIYVKNFIRSVRDYAQTCENHKSRLAKIATQDLRKSQPNNNESNNTDDSKTYPIYQMDSEMDERASYREYFMMQLEYEYLLKQYPYQEQVLLEILELIIDTVCSNREFIRIAGDKKPVEVVKSRFMQLESSHIQYVLTCMEQNGSRIRNIKQYLLASLYNAPLTINNYYAAMYHHDRANGTI